MKKFTSLLIGCSLALAGAAMAQQPDQTPKEKKQGPPEKTHAAEPKPGANAPKPEATVAKPRGARNERATSRGQKGEATPKSATSTGAEPNVSGEPAASATPAGKHQAQPRMKGKNAPAENAKTSPSAAPATSTSTGAAPPVSAAGQQNARAGKGAAKKPEPQQVQQIKAQHANFHAQPKPQQAPAVTFDQSRRIEGSERWQGQQYEVFRSYHPERHDEGWYHSHYNRVELIGGGYYYWNSGYWYPAWGYSPSAEYYAYDGPIYVGHRAEPPDQVIADVQAELQQMGYYQGEVDGLLGPMTRQALTAYQADQGLTTTAAIDEPTLDSLGLS
jgi:Putative peptidoglycan binding domain